jgi:hypothetical protein
MARRFVVPVVILAVVALVVLIVVRQPQAGLRGTSVPALSAMIPAGQAANLYKVAVLNYDEYRANSSRWSFAYFGSVFGAAILSAMAGVILKLDMLKNHPAARQDVAAISAALAALLITLSTMGRFEEKWRANRLAASAMESTIYDLAQKDADLTAIIKQMQEINRGREEAITAKAKAEKPAPAPPAVDQKKGDEQPKK